MATRDNPQFSIMGSQAVESAIHFAEVVWSSAWLFVLPPLLFAWALAEFFVRRRRMALPALILAGDFALPAFLVGVLVAVRLVPGTLVALAQSSVLMEVDRHAAANWPALLLVTSAVAVALNLAFWHRHRVPVAFAHAAAALLPLLFLDVAIAGSGRAWSDAFTWPALRVHMLAGGVLAFAGAMAWDWSDRTRQTQHADTAFWLHLLASALALPAIFGIAGEALGPYAGALVAYVALIVLAVVIDRRAVLVVGLAWLLPAIFAHGKTASANLVALAIAVGLMALILKWHALRARIPGLVATTGSGER